MGQGLIIRIKGKLMLGWLYVYFSLGFIILRKLTVKWGFTLTMFVIVSFLVDIFLRKKQRDDVQ